MSTTIRRLWKALTPEERAQGITAALSDDTDGWVRATTKTAIASALKFRPQTVADWPRHKVVSEAARLPLGDVQLLSAFLVDLHLGHRRPMMAAFLSDLGIPHEDGRIDSENVQVPRQEAAKLAPAADRLAAAFPHDETVTYFLTLLLQDSAIWEELSVWMQGD